MASGGMLPDLDLIWGEKGSQYGIYYYFCQFVSSI